MRIFRHRNKQKSIGSNNAFKAKIKTRSIYIQPNAAAFSLVEIMVVLVIIGLLAGVVTVNVQGYLIRGKQNTAKMEVARIVDAIDTFYSLHDRYPTNEEGLSVLYQGTDRMPEPLLDAEPIDPWQRAYQYNAPGREGPYEVISFGADGQEGGEGNDADVESWNLNQSS